MWYFRLWAGQPREDHRAAQDRAGLPQRPDPDLRRQQCVAAARGARSQPVDELPLETGAPPRRRTRKHTVVPLLQSVQTLRFELFHRAALLVRPGGKTRLRMTDNLPTRQTFTRIANALASG